MDEARTMYQTAPYPYALAHLVGKLRYRRHLGWQVWLEDDLQRDPPTTYTGESRGLTLVVLRAGPDTYNPDRQLRVRHYFPVPPATFDLPTWQRWLFDRLGDVDTHERMEDFALVLEGDFITSAGERVTEHTIRPFAPNHGPGRNPYVVHEYATDEARRTTFRGELNPT